MVNLDWCKKQEKGIRLIEPSIHLSEDYIRSAEETLLLLKEIQGKSNMWEATMKYYCEYFAVYSILLRLGITCEIHDCTIKLINFLEKEEIIPGEVAKKLEQDKALRIDNQYYLKNIKTEIDFNELSDFIVKMKNIVNSITSEDIQKIKNLLK